MIESKTKFISSTSSFSVWTDIIFICWPIYATWRENTIISYFCWCYLNDKKLWLYLTPYNNITLILEIRMMLLSIWNWIGLHQNVRCILVNSFLSNCNHLAEFDDIISNCKSAFFFLYINVGISPRGQ